MDITSFIKNSKRNRYIIISLIIVIKLVLMGFFSSDYENLMFIPFVNSFLNGVNPYTYFYNNSLPASFPYFPLMLLIESIGGVLVSYFNPANVFDVNIIFKLPLLVFDLLGFYVLRRLNVKFKYATVFYFCSPIILYATYMHGQLDIIPTTLLLLAVSFLLDWRKEQNLYLYAICLGLSLSCKAHIWGAVPILFFYVANKKGWFSAVKLHVISVLIVCLFTVPFWGEGFIHMVLFNKEQSSLLSVGIDYGPVQLAIPIAVMVIVYFVAFEMKYFNRSLLISLLGLLFTLFLICISPMPAWFTWIVPFYVLYFDDVEEDKYKTMLIYVFFNAVYLIYFTFLHITEYTDIYLIEKSFQYLKINNGAVESVVFTLMVACLFIIVLKIYRFGISSNNLYKRRGNSFAIGIAGDSGAGKSRLLDKIEHLFGSEKDILFIEGDGDHRWARNDENWEQYTALNPQANYLYRQAEDIRRLKHGNHVFRSDYDHNTGLFTESKRINAKKYVILCGLHSLYLPMLRDELDLKIFMDTDNELRNYWKIQRDTEKRGYSKEEIVAQINRRIPDAEKYIYPQKEYADIVITYFDKTLQSCYEEQHEVELSVKFEISVNVDVEGIIKSFEKYSVYPQLQLSEDFSKQIIIFDGKEILKDISFEKIAEENIPQYEELFTIYPQWGSDVEGVIQVMLLYMISEKMKG